MDGSAASSPLPNALHTTGYFCMPLSSIVTTALREHHLVTVLRLPIVPLLFVASTTPRARARHSAVVIQQLYLASMLPSLPYPSQYNLSHFLATFTPLFLPLAFTSSRGLMPW